MKHFQFLWTISRNASFTKCKFYILYLIIALKRTFGSFFSERGAAPHWQFAEENRWRVPLDNPPIPPPSSPSTSQPPFAPLLSNPSAHLLLIITIYVVSATKKVKRLKKTAIYGISTSRRAFSFNTLLKYQMIPYSSIHSFGGTRVEHNMTRWERRGN